MSRSETLVITATDKAGHATSTEVALTWTSAPTGAIFGSSIKTASDVATLRGYGTNPQAFRVFFTGQLPATWQGNGVLSSIPAGSTAIVSYHQVMTAAELTAFIGSVPRGSLLRRALRRLRLVKSTPAGITLILCYFHEPADNFTTAAQQAQFRSDAASQAAIIQSLGIEHWLILTGYTLSDAGHRAGQNEVNFYVPGAHQGLGIDFYSKLDLDSNLARASAFANAKGIRWGVTECGMSKEYGDDTVRVPYYQQLRTAVLASDASIASAWADQKSGSTFDTRWTPATARAFFGA